MVQKQDTLNSLANLGRCNLKQLVLVKIYNQLAAFFQLQTDFFLNIVIDTLKGKSDANSDSNKVIPPSICCRQWRHGTINNKPIIPLKMSQCIF